MAEKRNLFKIAVVAVGAAMGVAFGGCKENNQKSFESKMADKTKEKTENFIKMYQEDLDYVAMVESDYIFDKQWVKPGKQPITEINDRALINQYLIEYHIYGGGGIWVDEALLYDDKNYPNLKYKLVVSTTDCKFCTYCFYYAQKPKCSVGDTVQSLMKSQEYYGYDDFRTYIVKDIVNIEDDVRDVCYKVNRARKLINENYQDLNVFDSLRYAGVGERAMKQRRAEIDSAIGACYKKSKADAIREVKDLHNRAECYRKCRKAQYIGHEARLLNR
jgi:hypothetical protein